MCTSLKGIAWFICGVHHGVGNVHFFYHQKGDFRPFRPIFPYQRYPEGMGVPLRQASNIFQLRQMWYLSTPWSRRAPMRRSPWQLRRWRDKHPAAPRLPDVSVSFLNNLMTNNINVMAAVIVDMWNTRYLMSFL